MGCVCSGVYACQRMFAYTPCKPLVSQVTACFLYVIMCTCQYTHSKQGCIDSTKHTKTKRIHSAHVAFAPLAPAAIIYRADGMNITSICQ